MEQVKLNNQRLTERRRKAEEDENSFHVQEEQRRQMDAVKRAQDRKKKVEQEKARKELDDEREKNRQRKLNAVQAREWDSEKREEDYNPRGYNPRYRKGLHGSVAPRDAPASPRGGGAAAVASSAKSPDAPAEWPTLPGQKKRDKPEEAKAKDAHTGREEEMADLSITLPATGSSWAEQVEDGTPTTPA